MSNKKTCGAKSLMGKPVEVIPVNKIKTPEELILNCMPAFGAAYVRRIYEILDRVISREIPLIVAVSGPITVSNQHRIWLIPLIEAGYVAYVSTTDAVCYHDGHDSLWPYEERPLCEVPIEGFDVELREQGIIRVTDVGFPENILFEQDRMISSLLMQPEFQRRMTGTEFRNLLGKYYDAQEKANGISPGLLSTCRKYDIPIFVGAPGDGSAFLNSVKLWALNKLGVFDYKFDIDIHAEIFESCAYHFWGLKNSQAKQLAILILGGGVPKNFALQPEPTLSQIFMLSDIRGYDYDVQIVGAPVTDGSLTSAKAQEAHTWGKVSREALESNVESYQTDYSTVMPLIAWAIMEKRERFEKLQRKMGRKNLFERHPEARGYLRPMGFHLFSRRDKLVADLMEDLGKPASIDRLKATLDFPLAFRNIE